MDTSTFHLRTNYHPMNRLLASPYFRLALYAATLLLLPSLALLLAGQDWPEARMVVGHLYRPLLLASLVLVVLAAILDTLTHLRSGNSLLRSQGKYLLACAAAGAGNGMLLAWLNLFAGSWISPALDLVQMLLCAALAGAVTLPALLITRLWLAGISGWAQRLGRLPALPTARPETAASLLLLVALASLLGGTVWPLKAGLLYWLAPLLLLAALQLLWHESTVFAGLKQGDWGRVLLGALSAVWVCGLLLAMFRLYGGALYLRHSSVTVALALSAYGLLCLQLADIVAEFWRGTTLLQKYQKHSITIPIVTRKD